MIDVDRCDLLTAEEERDLARRIAGGDAGARDRLVLCNEPLARMFARSRWRPGRSVALEDLVQAGMLGVIRAADRYDGRGKFSAYAKHHILNEIRKAIREDSGPIQLAYNVQWIRTSLATGSRARADFTPTQLARVDQAEAALQACRGGGGSIFDAVARGVDPDDALDVGLLPTLLVRLPEAEREAIRSSFGLGRERPMLGVEIARRDGVTPEGARQRIKRGLARLREICGEGARP
jgi:RNA polymerase primary sigma factor